MSIASSQTTLRHVARAYRSGIETVRRVCAPLLDLYVRLWLAQTFFVSGVLKAADWDTALALARYEYPVDWLDPVTAAYLGASIELLAPLLLAFGLATRAAAFALFCLTLVIQTQYQVLDQHLFWMVLLAGLVVRGADALSLDRLFARGLEDSALPFATPVIQAAQLVTHYGGPLYALAVRVWLTAAFVLAIREHAEGLNAVLTLHTVTPLANAAMLALAVPLALGLATRMAAALMIALSLGLAMMSVNTADNLHALTLVLAGFVFLGSGPLSLDAGLGLWLQRRFPGWREAPAFDTPGLPRVVIVGAGFGGLACAQGLRDTDVSITLIDRHNYHLFQPLLYQVATTALSPGDIALPIRSLLRDQRNSQVLLGEVTGVDTQRREVLIGEQCLPYDYLVLATGASHSYFGRDDWEPYAPGLKRIEDSTSVRSRLLLAFERAEATEDATERAALLTFLVVGGGPTGVELAGAIAELARFGLEREFRRVDPAQARVLLVQAGPRILPTFPEALSAAATTALQKLQVEILTDSRVERIDADGVRVSGTAIVARSVFWAAGVVASPAAEWLGIERDRSGRIAVGADLSVAGLLNVFAVGDTAAANAWDGKPVPGLAPAAKQGGKYVARVIRARAEKLPAPSAFRYRHLGSLATIGRKAAVADFGRVQMTGALAWWLWGLVHVYFLAGMRNRVSVVLDWIWAYFTFRSSTRLITRMPIVPASGEQLHREPSTPEMRIRHGS